jgi:hypothetical protein
VSTSIVQNTYDSQKPEDPSVALVESHESANERRKRYTNGDHDSPYAHIPSPLLLEESLNHDGTTDGIGGRDEERLKSTTSSHGPVCLTLRASDVEDKTAGESNDEDWSTAKTCRKRSPE